VRLRLIGDVVFTTPIPRALRRRYPGAHLTYVVEPMAAPIVARNPHLDAVVVAPRRRGLDRLRDDWAMAQRLRRERFDVAIDLHGGPRSAWLTWGSRAPIRIGYRAPGRRWAYTHQVPRAPHEQPRHAVANQWDLLAPLGIAEPCAPARDAVEMAADPAAASRVERRLAAVGFALTDPLVMLHVSAGNPFRRWPPDAFAAVVAALAQRDRRRRFLITSGPSDADAARAVAERARQALGTGGGAVSHGEFDIAELRALAAHAAVYIGGDSGPMHIAATTATPIVALFGPTLPERSMPWRDPAWFAEAVDAGALPCRPCHQRTCGPGDFRCLTGIPPERVVAAVERAMASSRAPRVVAPASAEAAAASGRTSGDA
jgi:lipopolysaccharide heptosyltransferase II